MNCKLYIKKYALFVYYCLQLASEFVHDIYRDFFLKKPWTNFEARCKQKGTKIGLLKVGAEVDIKVLTRLEKCGKVL